jgi:hypothetical protein
MKSVHARRIMPLGGPMRDELPHLLDRIRRLLDRRGADAEGVLLMEMEHTLTDGYAWALALDGERRRIERKLGQLARDLEHPDQAGELRSLAARLSGAEGELESLRDLLVELRKLTEAARAA